MNKKKINRSICGVYRIFSKTFPERSYIGSSINVYGRRKEHINSPRNINIFYHIKEFGKKDLAFEILKICEERNLDFWEIYYIGEFNPCWNKDKSCGRPYKLNKLAQKQAKLDIKKTKYDSNLFNIEKQLFEISNNINENIFHINFEDLCYYELMGQDIL